MTSAARSENRTAIVEVALGCVQAVGWEATSLQVVRQRAGVSNGTLFHHFPTRQHLSMAVVAAGIADHQDGIVRELRAATTSRAGVTAVVLRHLRWIEDNPQLARMLLTVSPESLRAGFDPDAISANRRFFSEVAAWLHGAGWSGAPELPVLVALWIGPAQEYSRGWLAGPRNPLAPAASALAESAWHALHPLLGTELT